MSLARSTYYRRSDPEAASLRGQAQAAMRAAIENVVADWPSYGYRRVTHELRRRGIVVNHKKVARIMREAALTPRKVKRFVATTDSDHHLPIYPDLTKGLVLERPDQLWFADLTYIRLGTQFVYLAAIASQKGRRSDRCSTGGRPGDRIFARPARSTPRFLVPINTSNQEVLRRWVESAQYASDRYRASIKDFRMIQSMSRRANCWDNAPMESFFKTLKVERIHQLR